MDYKADVEQSQKRMEAWWHRDIVDRVVVQLAAPRRPAAAAAPPHSEAPDREPPTRADLERYFLDPAVVIPNLKRRLANTWFGGEAFPVMFPVSIQMVAVLANYLGCPLRFVTKDTTWHDPIIDDPNGLPRLSLDPENPVWKASLRLLEAATAESDGYFVGCPDLNGPTEILGLMRGHEEFAMDFHDQPGYIRPALEEITNTWYECWKQTAGIAHRAGGWFFWMGIWSENPAIDLQSDVSCLISKEAFDEHFLPSIERQTRMVARTIYHLDGPGAIRHLDSLLALPRLDAIQWVQGAGGGSVLDYVPLLKRIQAAKKLIYCYSEKSELEELLGQLGPEGLYIVVQDCTSPEEGREILRSVGKWTRLRG